MDDKPRRRTQGASFSVPGEQSGSYPAASGQSVSYQSDGDQFSRTERRRRMERYTGETQTDLYNNRTAAGNVPMTGAYGGTQYTGSAPVYSRTVNNAGNTVNGIPQYGNQSYGTGPYRAQSGGNGPYGNQPGGNRSYGAQPYANGNRTSGAQLASNGKPIRDWQRQLNAPPMTIRRDLTEDGEDPLLATTRSPNVYSRDGEFWGNNGKERPAVTERETLQNEETDIKTENGNRYRPLATAAIIVIILIGIWIILRFTIFRVDRITVSGTTLFSDEYVIGLSGIENGDNMLALNEEQIRNGIENEVRLIFDSLEKKVPGEVYITVREREPAAYLNYCGITYITDKNGTVLEENEDPDYRPEGLIEVKGLKIRSSFTAGQNLPLVTEEQTEVFKSLFREIRVIGCQSLIREADLSKTEEIYLLTADDISVVMGTIDDFHAKLRSMTVVREKILSMGYTGGSIDVSDPEHPSYVPPAL